MKKYRLSASHVLLASASLIVVMIVCLGIYQYCRAHVTLKQQIFTISYKEEIPTSSAYYFEGQAEEENTEFEESLFQFSKIGKHRVTVSFLGKDYEIVIELVDDVKPRIQFISHTFLLGSMRSFDEIVEVIDKSAVEVSYSLEEESLKEGTYTLSVTAVDAYGNQRKKSEEIQVVAVEMITFDPGYDYQNLSLEKLVDRYLSDQQIDAENLAIGYVNLSTGETYYQNETVWFTAASTYKLPLNMLYEEMINDKTLQEDSTLRYCTNCYEEGGGTTDYYYSVGSAVPLSFLMEQSLVHSCNTASHILFENLGGWRVFREMATKYSKDTVYPDDYYSVYHNETTARYLLDTAAYLYAHRKEYAIVIEHLKNAMPQQYLKTYVEYPIAQKYGLLDSYRNVVGIVYTPTPYATVILTHGLADGEKTIAELNAVIAHYHLARS